MNDLLLQAESGVRATVSSFVSSWESLFGVYKPIDFHIGTYPNYEYIYIGPDYGYIARVLFFIVVVFCILKMIGGIFKHGKS